MNKQPIPLLIFCLFFSPYLFGQGGVFIQQNADGVQAAKANFYPHYYVPGDTSAIVKQNLRESAQQALEEYPSLDGRGISHGEGMAGMTPLQRQQWMDTKVKLKRGNRIFPRVHLQLSDKSHPESWI